MNLVSVNLALAAQMLEAYIARNTAVMLHGAPGIGKSQTVRQVAKSMKRNLITIILSLRDPVDLRGLPWHNDKDGTTVWLPPAELPNIKKHGKSGILFLDEINTSNKSMEAAAMSLVLDRKIGEYELPEGWIPIAAGNRVTDKAIANRLGSAMRNRFAHIEVEPDVEAWCDWAARNNVPPIGIAHIKFRPQRLHVMPTGDDNAFPTPRSWVEAFKYIDEEQTIRQYLIGGLVGKADAGELEGTIRTYMHMPSIKQILLDPRSVHIPDLSEPSMLHALTSALAHRVDQKSLGNAMSYAARLPKEWEVTMVQEAVKRQPDLAKTKAYVSWAVKNQESVV